MIETISSSSLQSPLEAIKRERGVMSVVLVQRDGLPVASAGVWLSPGEIFMTGGATACIFNVAREQHRKLNYILVEGVTANIVISPVFKDRYFLAIVTSPRISLGSMFLKIRRSLTQLEEILSSLPETLPPLRSYSESDVGAILKGFRAKAEGESQVEHTHPFRVRITGRDSTEMQTKLGQFAQTLGGQLISGVISFQGGYVLSALDSGNKINRLTSGAYELGSSESEATTATALYDTSVKICHLLKKFTPDLITCDNPGYTHIVCGLDVPQQSVFSFVVNKDRNHKLGMLRLIIPQFISSLETTVKGLRQRDEIGVPLFKSVDLMGDLLEGVV